MRRVCHLVDDTSPGGVTRFLEYIQSSPAMAALGHHEVVAVGTGLRLPPRIEADVVVSHIVLSWKNLPFFFALRAQTRGIPLIHMEHSYSPAFANLYVSARGRFRRMLSVSLSLFDHVIAISSPQRAWLLAETGLSPEKIALIPPYLDLSKFLNLPPVTRPIKRIGAIGRLDQQKGFDLLIEAFKAAKLDGITLEIFGAGPERKALAALAENDAQIAFHGHIANPVLAMQSVDAIAMPSRREPYGLVALEALAAGRPLLVSRTDGLVDHAQNGAIPVDRFDVDSWARALRNLCQSDHGTRGIAARANARRAEQKFIEGWSTLLNGGVAH